MSRGLQYQSITFHVSSTLNDVRVDVYDKTYKEPLVPIITWFT